MPGRGRGRGRGSAAASSAVDSSAVDSSNSSTHQPPLEASQPVSEPAAVMPRMTWFEIRQFQNLFVAIAFAEIRQRGDAGTLSVAEQRTQIVIAYKRAIVLWYRDDATLNSITNFPACPQAIRSVGSEVVATRSMMSTTASGNRSFTGESMLNLAKELKKKMLGLIAIWNVACNHPAQAATIARPGTGVLEDTVYLKVVSIMYVQLLPVQLHCIFVTLIAGTESKKLSALLNCDVSILASDLRNQISAL
jgi:hypothetical protein